MPDLDFRTQIATIIAKQDEMLRRMDRFDGELDTKFCTKEYSASQDRRIAALEETIKWVARTVLGVVILAVLGATIVIKKGGI